MTSDRTTAKAIAAANLRSQTIANRKRAESDDKGSSCKIPLDITIETHIEVVEIPVSAQFYDAEIKTEFDPLTGTVFVLSFDVASEDIAEDLIAAIDRSGQKSVFTITLKQVSCYSDGTSSHSITDSGFMLVSRIPTANTSPARFVFSTTHSNRS